MKYTTAVLCVAISTGIIGMNAIHSQPATSTEKGQNTYTPKVGTFMDGCEMMNSLGGPMSVLYQTPVAVCAAIREQVKELGIQQAAQKCEDGLKLAFKLTNGMPPELDVPSQIGRQVSLACNWILVGPY